jgi:hypothetical protein
MAVVEKYQALRDFKFNGRKFGRGDAIAHDYIVSVSPEKLGTLLRTRFIAPPPDRQLEDMTMSELREMAREVGLEGPLPRGKKDLVAVIESEM